LGRRGLLKRRGQKRGKKIKSGRFLFTVTREETVRRGKAAQSVITVAQCRGVVDLKNKHGGGKCAQRGGNSII